MRSLAILALLVIIVLGSGALTANLGGLDFAIIQTDSPDASVFTATPGQSAAFFFFVGFVIVNVLGAGLTIMGVFWFLNREISRAQVEQPENS